MIYRGIKYSYLSFERDFNRFSYCTKQVNIFQNFSKSSSAL
jgi:hypothetical protein